MEILRIACGTIAVHGSRLVIVCAVKPAGQVAIRDLVSGETFDVSVGELSAQTTPARASDAARIHADVVTASPKRYRAAQQREKVVVAALVREGPSWLAVEQTSAVSDVSARTLWRWISLYRAQPCTAGLLLDKRGVAPAGAGNEQTAEVLSLGREVEPPFSMLGLTETTT